MRQVATVTNRQWVATKVHETMKLINDDIQSYFEGNPEAQNQLKPITEIIRSRIHESVCEVNEADDKADEIERLIENQEAIIASCYGLIECLIKERDERLK